MAKITLRAVIPVALLLALSCKTTGPKEDLPPHTRRQFIPAQHVSMLHADEGRYTDLFSGDSYAVWVDSMVMEYKHKKAVDDGETVSPHLKKDAQTISQDFIVIECHMASEFSDMSVAYDAVRLRGINLYLATPDGKKVRPIQSHAVAPVEEQPRDALKRFGQTHVIIFSRDDLWVGGPNVIPGAQSVRLAIEGQSTNFHFQWPGMLSEEELKRPWSVEEAARVAQLGFTELYGSLRRLARIFH